MAGWVLKAENRWFIGSSGNTAILVNNELEILWKEAGVD
jgi:hypothetical protein